MSRLDESRPFLPVRIAVLTISDTRDASNDTSGDTLAARIEAAGHVLAGRAIGPRRRGRDRSAPAGVDSPGLTWMWSSPPAAPESPAGDVTPEAFARGAGKDHRGLRRAVPHAQLRQDRHQHDAIPRFGRGWPVAPTCSRCPAAPAR